VYSLIGLLPLVARTYGDPAVRVALIDGPVFIGHPELVQARIEQIGCRRFAAVCDSHRSIACAHGTFMAGIFAARRGGPAAGICPGCTLLLRPVFSQQGAPARDIPTTTPSVLADAIKEAVSAGVRVINLSVGVGPVQSRDEGLLIDALDLAAARDVVTVAASGNEGVVGTSVITRHAAVIPVAACDIFGRPTNESNLSATTGRRGLLAPGQNVTSLSPGGLSDSIRGSSVATAVVSASICLLWSMHPKASHTAIKHTLLAAEPRTRRTIVPRLLNAWSAYQRLSRTAVKVE
jgi:subtilisin family serine protease